MLVPLLPAYGQCKCSSIGSLVESPPLPLQYSIVGNNVPSKFLQPEYLDPWGVSKITFLPLPNWSSKVPWNLVPHPPLILRLFPNLTNEFFFPPPLHPKRNVWKLFQFSRKESEEREQLIIYVGIDCITDLIKTSLPALVRDFSFHPFKRLITRSNTTWNTWLFDRPISVGRPKYFE